MDYGANDAGGTFYAGQTFTGDPRGRVIQTVWQPAARGSIWSGNLTFPAELRLRTFPDGVRLTRTPVDELASLRSGTVTVADRTVTPAAPLSPASGDTYEITAEFDTSSATAASFGLKLHTRSDGTYDRAVTYDRAAQTLYGAPLSPVDDRVTMRVLVDRGQLEVWGKTARSRSATWSASTPRPAARASRRTPRAARCDSSRCGSTGWVRPGAPASPP
jgi:fructan beta-fructosidase